MFIIIKSLCVSQTGAKLNFCLFIYYIFLSFFQIAQSGLLLPDSSYLINRTEEDPVRNHSIYYLLR